MTRRRFRLPEETGVIIALLVMILIIGIARPRFLNPLNLLTILGHTTFLGILAIGMVFLLAIREIDLSVGWMFNFSATVSALAMVGGVDPWIAAGAGVLFGALLGFFNGILCVVLRLPAIIVTLGTYSMFQGLSLVVNGGRAVVPSDTSSSFFSVVSIKLFGIVPVTALVFVVLAIVMHFVLHRTRFGYQVQAVGTTPRRAAQRRYFQLGGAPPDAGVDGRDLRACRGDVCRLSWRGRPECRLRLRARRDRRRHHRGARRSPAAPAR
jgi:ribose transport system permease protein